MSRCTRALGRVVAELLPLVALTAVVLYAVGRYLGDQYQGGGDSLWYYSLVSDVLQQVRAGVFPVGVGQTNANWNGYPTALVPGFLLTGVAIDTATGGRLSVVAVMQAVAVWSLWAGAVSAYFCLRGLLPGRRWLSAALACAYVSCPAVVSLLTAGDMYPAFSTTPYYPPLLYGLIRGARRADTLAVALVGASLALLWMCHAGVALWCSTGTALFLAGYAVLSGRLWQTARFSATSAALFLVLAGWYFGTIFALGIHRNHTFNQHQQKDASVVFTGKYYSDVVTGVIERSVPKALLPLPAKFDGLAVQQLGYSLLALLAFAAVMATRVRSLELRLFVAGGLVLLASVLPIPQFTWHFWAYLPRPYLITEKWPMTRFGIVLGGVCVFAAALAAERLLASGGGRVLVAVRSTAPDGGGRRGGVPVRSALAALAGVVAIGVCYSLSELATLRGMASIEQPDAPRAAVLARPENQRLSVFNWLTFRDPRGEGRENVKDLYLYDRVLASGGEVLASNGDVAARGATVPFEVTSDPATPITPGPARPVVTFRVEPGKHYLLTLDTDPRNADYWFPVAGGTLDHAHRPPYNGVRPQTVVIPIWTTATEPQDVRVSAVCVRRPDAEGPSVRVEPRSLVAFVPDALPVKVHGLMPYTATVRADRPCDLETHRQFVPGYVARVNGVEVEARRSSDGMLLVPLVEGENEVTLTYRGPLLSRVAFVVSAAGWLGLLGFGLYGGCRALTSRVPTARNSRGHDAVAP